MSTQTTRVIQVYRYGGPEQLKLEQKPRPEPQAGEVLLRVHAAGVNQIDWKIRQGLMKDFQPVTFPYTPGIEVAGVVEDVGPGVTAFEIGQAVFGWSERGAYAEYITVPVEALALKPETLSFAEAATVPVGATAAWRALFDHGGLTAGQRVLIQGAAGGMGLFAVQFAKWKGAQVIGTASTANLEFVRGLGADTVVDYTTTTVESVVQDVDLVLDGVGAETLSSSLAVLKPGGTLISLAGLPPQEQARERGVRATMIRSQRSREVLMFFSQGADIDGAAPMPRHLNRNVGRSPEAIETQPFARLDAAHTKRAVADDAGAEQRRRLLVGELLGDAIHEGCRRHKVFGVAAVDVPAGKRCLLTEVLSPNKAEAASPTRFAEPGNPDPVARGEPLYSWPGGRHLADDFVAGNERQLWLG